MTERNIRQEIDDFESHYGYDTTFMRELLETSPGGYQKFDAFLPMAHHNEKLNAEDFWVTKLAAMRVADCGACLALNVRMAREAGVSKELIAAAANGGSRLEACSKDLYEFAAATAANEVIDSALMKRIESRYDKGALLEIGISVASAVVFPTIKRALGYTQHCQLIEDIT
jgi:AhpD family alkylhydroperoxidase